MTVRIDTLLHQCGNGYSRLRGGVSSAGSISWAEANKNRAVNLKYCPWCGQSLPMTLAEYEAARVAEVAP